MTELKVVGEVAATVVGTELIAAKAISITSKTLRFSKIPKFNKSLVGLAKEAPEAGTKLTKQRVTKYLEKVHEVPREQLVKDLESIGLKKAEGSKTDGVLNDKFLKFKHKTDQFQVEIHEPHIKRPNGAKHPHLHIKNKQGQPLNKDLIPVEADSPEAHIKIKEFSDLTLKGKQ